MLRIVRCSTAIIIASIIGTASPALDRIDDIKLSFKFSDTQFGGMHIKARDDGTRYAANATFRTAGLVDMILDVRYDANVSGVVKNFSLSPIRYSETERRRNKLSELLINYDGGKLRTTINGVEQVAVDGNRTIDPLTALYSAFRDSTRNELCNSRLLVHDGTRTFGLELKEPAFESGRAVCEAEYERIDGFSPEDMEERTIFPFTAHFESVANDSDIYTMSRIVFPMSFGTVLVVRSP